MSPTALFPRPGRRKPVAHAVITTAGHGRSTDLSNRQVRYTITMVIRVLCFVSMIFVPGVGRWILLAGAAFLPGIAVLFANAVDQRRSHGRVRPPDSVPEYHTALSTGPEEIVSGTVLDHHDH